MSCRIKAREEEVRESQKARDKALKKAKELEQQNGELQMENEDLTKRIGDLQRKLEAKGKKTKVL